MMRTSWRSAGLWARRHHHHYNSWLSNPVTNDWQTFLVNKLVGIKSYHYLQFTCLHKGSVFVKLKSARLFWSQTQSLAAFMDSNCHGCTWTSLPLGSQAVVPLQQNPWVLSERYHLLHQNHQQCPHAATPLLPPAPQPLLITTTTTPAIVFLHPYGLRYKRPRLCGICTEQGHNSRSCPKK